MYEIIVKQDFDGYFERVARQIASYALAPKFKRIIVTAGPYRSDALTVNKVKDDPEAINLDFYSAIRNGFGQLTETDLREAAKLI